jgi:hypothetical protein
MSWEAINHPRVEATLATAQFDWGSSSDEHYLVLPDVVKKLQADFAPKFSLGFSSIVTKDGYHIH